MDGISPADDGGAEAQSLQPMHNSASLPEDAALHGVAEPNAAALKSPASILSSKP
jgi:hypothetical protein